MANNAEDVLKIARGQIGYSRWNDPEKGSKYGRWYAKSHGSYFAENGVPFCAMFVSWVFDQAKAKCVGVPGAYCPTMLTTGRNAGKAVGIKSAKAGDVVYFDWGGDNVSDHVGLIESNNGRYLTTIEGNTDNGQVKRKTRAYSTVMGIIRPDYGATAAKKESKVAGNKNVRLAQRYLSAAGFDIGEAGIDGICGADTCRANIKHMQYQMDRLGQNLTIDGELGPLTKNAFMALGDVSKKKGKPGCIKGIQVALQCHGYSVGSAGIDGEFGSDTDAAVRKFQKANKLTVDGIVGLNTFTKLFR